MKAEARICQNCKKDFTIEPDDFGFYEKIKVPPPTWCPGCRLQRKLIFLNERTLYKRKCNLCKKDILAVYSEDATFPVYCTNCWRSDKWEPLNYGKPYDFSKPFFTQLKELIDKVPMMNLLQGTGSENSEYTNNVGSVKNCYLVFNCGGDLENCYYSTRIIDSRKIFNSVHVKNTEIANECFNLEKCSRVFFSHDCENSVDLYFCKNCAGCSDCFGCTNLRSKQYHIFNQPYSREEYKKNIGELKSGSYKKCLEYKTLVEDQWRKFPVRYMQGTHNNNISGNYILNSKNALNSFFVKDAKDCKWVYMGDRIISECYDYFQWGNNAENIYECIVVGKGAKNIKFSSHCRGNLRDMQYCIHNYTSCSNLFGCVGLRTKSYCILNKQYSKEEYEKIVLKIISQMKEMPYVDKLGHEYYYGEFFPPELSYFSYDETVAPEYFPLNKKEAEAQGYSWKEAKERNYKITILPKNLPDDIENVPDNIVSEVIGCLHAGHCNHQCTTAFKIIPQELQFYKSMNMPIPRLCPNCRYYEILESTAPIKTWHRLCQCAGAKSSNGVYQNTSTHFHGAGKCEVEFETSYAPDRPEIIYCEKCYQQEVY